MLQGFEGYYFPISIVFILLGFFAAAWLIIHIEHGRHFSKFKVGSALFLTSILIGFGIHFLLLSAGM
jgi:multisubunit Na+/H+ antiporter MnhC subunit